MAKKGFEVIKPQHDDYVERFQTMAGVLINLVGKEELDMRNAIDTHLDKHALDYPEIVIEYQLTRLEVEVVGMLV